MVNCREETKGGKNKEVNLSGHEVKGYVHDFSFFIDIIIIIIIIQQEPDPLKK